MQRAISSERSEDRRENVRFRTYCVPGITISAVLLIFIWRFALIGKKTLFVGDAVTTCLPLAYLRSLVVHGHISPLWTSGVYGGHPMLAEGQVAYFHPLAMAVAALSDSLAGAIYGLNLFAFLCGIVSTVGVLGLCRQLGLSRWSAVFAVLAVVFSSSWLLIPENGVIAGSFVWVPWCLWAVEAWLDNPAIRSGALMGGALAGLLMSGYPQTFHGTLIYIAVRLIATVATRAERQRWGAALRVRLFTGVLASIVCAALAAVQLLPLLELTSLSHRHAGTGLVFQVGWPFYLRGLLYSWMSGMHYALPSVGSLLVCFAASLLIVFNPAPRLLGHLAAGIVLFMLGCGHATPIFSVIYDHHLLPGLHFFRTTQDYLAVGTIAIGVAAAGAVDGMTWWRLQDWQPLARSARFWGAVTIAVLWGAVAAAYWTPDMPVFQIILPVAAGTGLFFLARMRALHFAEGLMIGLLLAECMALRLHPLELTRISALAEPPSVRAIEAQPDWREYRTIDEGYGMANMMTDGTEPSAGATFLRMMTAMSGMTPVIWKLHGVKGGLALPLARWRLAEPVMDDEAAGAGGTRAGLRLIDVQAVRFISAEAPIAKPGFRQFWHEPGLSWITENTAALPRFQFYDRAVFVDTPEAALDYIRNWNERVLVVEDPSRTAEPIQAKDETAASAPAVYSLQSARDTAYRLDVAASRPCWLFLADSNYPGWRATVDGVESRVFSAQVLGKAVWIPPGHHEVRIEFHSTSFLVGAWISAAALLATAGLVFWRRSSV